MRRNHKNHLLSLIRKMVLICSRNNILFRAKHLPGVQNGLADSLSRLQVNKFKKHVSRDGSGPDSPTRTFEAGELGDTYTLGRLLEASLSATSLSTYRCPWDILHQFKNERLQATTSIFPLSSDNLALFLAFLAEKTSAGSTVMTYISALSFRHRLAGWPDPTKSEMVKLALRGYSKLYPSQDTRLPTTLPILERIITACNDVFSVCYQRKLIKAMYALAVFATLRVGEITGGQGQRTKNVITIDQFFFLRDELNNIVTAKLVLKHYKHSDPTKPVELLMYREHPVSLMLDYVTLRGSAPGHFFAGLMGQLFLDLILPGLSKKFYNIATLMKIDIKHTAFA